MTHLVKIIGNMALRFSGRTLLEKAELEPDLAPGQLKAAIEEFRAHGVPEEDRRWSPAPTNPEKRTFDRIARELLAGRCARCGADMAPGVAIRQTLTGSPDFPGATGPDAVCTVSPGGPGALVGCSKCTECGWSVTL